MPETELSAAPATEPATSSSIATIDPFAPRGSSHERTEAWHQHVIDNADSLHEEMVEAREILHTGTAADAIALANEDVPRRARHAAARWRAGAQA
jgi:hypothetical protein